MEEDRQRNTEVRSEEKEGKGKRNRERGGTKIRKG